ncbi:hypothetical protein FBU30_004356 [Linnemannia zychae]|nr:hypothetical protein FBU30_004356 [Linnemannia zychae]
MLVKTLFTGEYSLILIGNPGTGKSTILNALGGNFPCGFSAVSGLTRSTSTEVVGIDGRTIRLVDIPGLYDRQLDDEHITRHHFELLHETLNNGHSYVIFFVITPINGRIQPADFAVMQTVLDNLERAPLVGLILTQVKRDHYDAIQASGYFETVQNILRASNANLKFFNITPPLILFDHDREFTRAEENTIKDYILTFEPVEVHVRRMISNLLNRLISFFIMLILG